jgi:hypothetical protein
LQARLELTLRVGKGRLLALAENRREHLKMTITEKNKIPIEAVPVPGMESTILKKVWKKLAFDQTAKSLWANLINIISV